MIPKSTRERWRAELANRTPGQWRANHGSWASNVTTETAPVAECSRTDAALIASAPDAMSQLLDEVERLRELVKEVADVALPWIRCGIEYQSSEAEARKDESRITAITAEVSE